MAGLLVFFLVIIAILLGVAGAVTTRMARQQRQRVDELRAADDHRGRAVLHYRVPAGQDPAMVTLGLTRAGFDAVEDPQGERPLELLIGGPGGSLPDREKVRATLADITRLNPDGHEGTLPGPVRFTDEVVGR